MKLTQYKKLEFHELEKANMVINQFVTSCSHSMRGPLKSIEGLVNLLYQRNKYSQADATAFLDLIGQTAIKMENMLDELEQILENSKREMILKKIDWREIIDSVLTRYHKEINENNVKVETCIVETIEFTSDLHRVHLILSHLIENAVQFQDPNKSNHSVHIGVETSKKNCVIRISDNGIGIGREVQGLVFNLFFRATQKTKGAGLGLYVVSEAVEKMGGTITVESIVEMGSVFIITLPNLAAKPS